MAVEQLLTVPEQPNSNLGQAYSAESGIEELRRLRLALGQEALDRPVPVVELSLVSSEELDDLWTDYLSKRTSLVLPYYTQDRHSRRAAVEIHDLVICKPSFVAGEDHETRPFKVIEGFIGSRVVYSKTVDARMGTSFIWRNYVEASARRKVIKEDKKQRQKEPVISSPREVSQLSEAHPFKT